MRKSSLITCYLLFLKEKGLYTSLHILIPHKAEWKNKHLLNITQALLFQKNMPKSYWREVVLIVTHLINQLPSKVLENKTLLGTHSKFFPHFNSFSKLTKFLVIYRLSMSILQIATNLIPEL